MESVGTDEERRHGAMAKHMVWVWLSTTDGGCEHRWCTYWQVGKGGWLNAGCSNTVSRRGKLICANKLIIWAHQWLFLGCRNCILHSFFFFFLCIRRSLTVPSQDYSRVNYFFPPLGMPERANWEAVWANQQAYIYQPPLSFHLGG